MGCGIFLGLGATAPLKLDSKVRLEGDSEGRRTKGRAGGIFAEFWSESESSRVESQTRSDIANTGLAEGELGMQLSRACLVVVKLICCALACSRRYLYGPFVVVAGVAFTCALVPGQASRSELASPPSSAIGTTTKAPHHHTPPNKNTTPPNHHQHLPSSAPRQHHGQAKSASRDSVGPFGW